MRRFLAATLSLSLATLTFPAGSRAAEPCPAEVAQAKAALKGAQASLKKNTQVVAKSQEIQAPRSQQDIQAPRSQEIQAPRSQQDIQAPRSQEIQAPRSQQDIQVPRSQEIQAPRVTKAGALVRQAEAACKKGDATLAARKAREALALLGK